MHHLVLFPHSWKGIDEDFGPSWIESTKGLAVTNVICPVEGIHEAWCSRFAPRFLIFLRVGVEYVLVLAFPSRKYCFELLKVFLVMVMDLPEFCFA